jgi:hypothetical protein
MTDFQINDNDLTGFQGKVAIVTGNALQNNVAFMLTTNV